jgi:hypothetical protein
LENRHKRISIRKQKEIDAEKSKAKEAGNGVLAITTGQGEDFGRGHPAAGK